MKAIATLPINNVANVAPTTKRVVFCFDGTSQDPSDAIQESETSDEGSISNVLKLHLLFGGDLVKGNKHKDLQQHSLYYSGVGTTEKNPVAGLLEQAFALGDPKEIVDEAMNDLKNVPRGAEIVVVGFSRGAAIARQFCSTMAKQQEAYVVSLLLCFDTVASIGMPDLSASNRPSSNVVFEDKTRSVSEIIQHAVHCVSLDDKRTIFQPTLMNHDERVLEIWFAGAHSDIGGGYQKDGLSDVVLEFAMEQIKKTTSLKMLSENAISYEDVEPVLLDDIEISPNVLDKNHEQKSLIPFWLSPLHYHRRLVVVENDEIALQHVPIVHESVIERIRRDSNYRPQSLIDAARYTVWTPDGVSTVMKGIDETETRIEPANKRRRKQF